MFKERQVVDDHSQEELLSAGFIGARAQGGSKDSLVLREGPLHVDSIPVDPIGKPALQLTAVLGLRPFSLSPHVDGGHERAYSDGAAQEMVGFTVIGAVGQDPVPVDSHRSVHDGGGELGSIVPGTPTHFGSEPEVRADVAKHRQLGIGGRQEVLGLGMLTSVMATDVSSFITRRVDDSLRLGFDQAAASGSISEEIEESINEPFFKRR